AHRKAALMLRQSLDPHSVYVDAARHGDGLTSLQYRDATNADTHEMETAAKPVLYSTLETVIVASTDRRVRYVAPAHIEAPNWTRDGAALIFNQDGTMYRWRLDN